MESSLFEAEAQLSAEFDKIVDGVKKSQAYDCLYNNYGTKDLANVQAASIAVKNEILEKNRLKTTLPCSNGLVVASKLNDRLGELCVEYNTEVISFLHTKKNELQRSVENLSIHINKQNFIAKKLKEQLEEKQSNVNRNPKININKHIKYYEMETKNTRREKDNFNRKMESFIMENLPENITGEGTDQRPKILKQLRAVPRLGKQYLPLNSLIRLLTIQCRESPQNAYVDVSNSPVFPPYLELLLRNNIVVRHSSNYNLIKLCYCG